MPPESSLMSPSPSLSTVPSSVTAKCAKLQDLMPPELLYATITLARPTSAIPRTCALLHSICATGHDIHVAWRNQVLLGDLNSRPSTADAINDPNVLLSDRSNIVNTLDFLFQLAGDESPQMSTGFAPILLSQHDPLFTVEYLIHLYTHTFLGVPMATKSVSIASQATMRTFADIFAAFDRMLGNVPIDYNWWRPVTDALVLPVYFVRVGRLDLLEVCLQLMVESPWAATLAELQLPGVSWWYLCHDHPGLRSNVLVGSSTYPQFIAKLALLHWSLPTLQLVLCSFPALSPASLIQLLSSNACALENQMLATLSPLLPNNADRCIDLYEWLQARGVLRRHLPLVKKLQGSGVKREAIERALKDVDIPHWIRIANDPDAGFMCIRFKSAVMRCIGEYEAEEWLQILLDRGLMAPREWGTLIPFNVDKWWPIMLPNALTHGERRAIVLDAIDQTIPFPSSIPKLAHLAQTDYNIEFLGVILGGDGFSHHQESLILFLSLIDCPMFPNPSSALSRILAHLDTRRVSQYVVRCQELCALAAFFFFTCTMRNPAVPVQELECVRSLSPARLAILVACVIIGIALADAVFLDYIDMHKQMAAAEALFAHACRVLKTDSPMVSVRPMFDLIAPGLRLFVCDMIRETMVGHDSDQDGYYTEPEYVKWMFTQLVRLDSQFAALGVMLLERPDELLDNVIDLIPRSDWRLARLSCSIMFEAEAGSLPLVVSVGQGDRWKQAAAGMSKDAIVQVIRRVVVVLGNNAGGQDEALWIQRQGMALRFVDTLFAADSE